MEKIFEVLPVKIAVLIILIFSVQSFARCQEIDPNDLDSLQQVYPALASISPEVKAIISKDPWREVAGKTNFIFEKPWVEFQGEVIEEHDDFLVFKGRFGTIGEIRTEKLGTVSRTDVSSTSSGELNNKYNAQFKGDINGNYNSQGSYRQYTNNLNRYKQNGQFNASGNDQYNAYDKTSSRQQINTSQTTIQKSLNNFGDDLFVVANFPFPLDIKYEFQELVAKRSGYQIYTNKLGRRVTLPRLDYGTPCEKTFSQRELDEIKEQREAPIREELKRQAEAEERMKQKEAAELKIDSDMAAQGNYSALVRMALRYRNGRGVEKDINMAEQYDKQAQVALQKQADMDLEKSREQEQQALKDKFEKNLYLADNMRNVESTLYVEKCYRLGIGTEIDLKKADEYHAKAVSLGIPLQQYNSR